MRDETLGKLAFAAVIAICCAWFYFSHANKQRELEESKVAAQIAKPAGPVLELPTPDPNAEAIVTAIGDAITKSAVMTLQSAGKLDMQLAKEIAKQDARVTELERDKYWPHPRSEMDKRLWDRIDALEKRVKELEGKR